MARKDLVVQDVNVLDVLSDVYSHVRRIVYHTIRHPRASHPTQVDCITLHPLELARIHPCLVLIDAHCPETNRTFSRIRKADILNGQTIYAQALNDKIRIRCIAMPIQPQVRKGYVTTIFDVKERFIFVVRTDDSFWPLPLDGQRMRPCKLALSL